MNSRLMESEPRERRKLLDRAAIAFWEGRLTEAAYLKLKRRHEPYAAPAAVPAATPQPVRKTQQFLFT